MFDMHDRVKTPMGTGKVAYRRMKAPSYSEVECYSVLLDSTVETSKHPPFPQTNGTIFPANDVTNEDS